MSVCRPCLLCICCTEDTGRLQAFFDVPGHGKLLVDSRTYPLAYATNVNQPYVFEVCDQAALLGSATLRACISDGGNQALHGQVTECASAHLASPCGLRSSLGMHRLPHKQSNSCVRVFVTSAD